MSVHTSSKSFSLYLCDGGSRSRSRNGSRLGASLDSSDSSGGGNGSSSNGGINVGDGSRGSLGVGRAVAGDVASLGTLVADLAGGAEGAAVGGSAVAGDVAELAAGVALHGLSLAVTGEVVGAAALVAGRSTGIALEATAETALETTPGAGRTASAGSGGVGAVALVKEVSLVVESYGGCMWSVLQRGDRAGCSCSSGRWHHRSGGGWGSQPGRDRGPGSCSTAWLEASQYHPWM